MKRSPDLLIAPDYRIEFSFSRCLVQVSSVFIQRIERALSGRLRNGKALAQLFYGRNQTFFRKSAIF